MEPLTRTIPLSRGKTCLIEEADWPLVCRHRWGYLPNDRTGYAVRWDRVLGKRRTIYMHRELLSARRGQLVDHENGDGLDNRRSNLRLCDAAQNSVNRAAPARSIPYRGVYRGRNPATPWRAQIKFQQCSFHLGAYRTQEGAARAYDRAALHFFGAFARLNFPGEAERTRTLPLPPTIERRLLQPLLPVFDGTDPWSDEDFPDPPCLAMSRGEALALQRFRQASAATALAIGAGSGTIEEGFEF